MKQLPKQDLAADVRRGLTPAEPPTADLFEEAERGDKRFTEALIRVKTRWTMTATSRSSRARSVRSASARSKHAIDQYVAKQIGKLGQAKTRRMSYSEAAADHGRLAGAGVSLHHAVDGANQRLLR